MAWLSMAWCCTCSMAQLRRAWLRAAWHGMPWRDIWHCLHSMARYGISWHNLAWRSPQWHSMAWHGMAWQGTCLRRVARSNKRNHMHATHIRANSLCYIQAFARSHFGVSNWVGVAPTWVFPSCAHVHVLPLQWTMSSCPWPRRSTSPLMSDASVLDSLLRICYYIY